VGCFWLLLTSGEELQSNLLHSRKLPGKTKNEG
jgi:hypothetical protein